MHWNSTYSGSLLHNNRHLTQGSPDFTDSKKWERGREDSAGKGSQRERGDRARPALVTGVQNSPELQLQVRLNIFRADTISPLPTPRPVRLDHLRPPSSPSAKEPPGATLGLGRAGQPQQHQLTPSSCSPELLAQGLKCFSLWSVLAGHSGSVLPQHSLATLGPGTAHSPVTCGRRTHFSPPVCVSCPTAQCLHRLWKCEAETPTASWDGRWQSTGRELAVSVMQAGKDSGLPHPHAVSSHCRAAKRELPASAWISLEPSHVQALLCRQRHREASARARGLCCHLLKSPKAGTSLSGAAEGCRQPLEEPSSNLLPLYDTQDSPRGERMCLLHWH